MNVVRALHGAALAAVTGLAGCQSIDGYKLVPVRDSTGAETGEVRAQPVHGVPIAVKRPTKAVFIVKATTYRVSERVPKADGTGEVVVPRGIQTELEMEKEPVLLGPTEVYTLDLKRPFYGTIDYNIEFENYYPKKIDGKVDDKTLSEVRQFVKDLVDKFAPTPGIRKEAGAAQLEKTVIRSEIRLVVIDLLTGRVEVRDLGRN